MIVNYYIYNQSNHDVSYLQEVCYHDSNGYPTVGYLRCSKVVRRQSMDDESRDSDANEALSTSQPSTKKAKKTDDITSSSPMKKPDNNSAMALQSLQKNQNENQYIINGEFNPAASTNSSSSSSRGHHNKFNSGNSDSNTSEDSNGKTDTNGYDNNQNVDDQEDEFICVIRPADVSIPQGASVLFQTYLSTASMVEHDRKSDNATHAHTNTTINIAENNRGGSPSCSLSNDSGSDDKFGSSGDSGQSSGNLVGTGTSSETGSDESDSA